MRLNMEQLKAMQEAKTSIQAGGKRPATRNPQFPLWSLQMGKKFMVYFPSTPVKTVIDADGNEKQDYVAYNYVAHQLSKDGKGGMSVRCVNGLGDSAVASVLGYSGTCPACEAMGKCWDVYKDRVDKGYKTKGITDTTSKEAKDVRAAALELMPVKNSESYVTVPIVIVCEGTTFPKNAEQFELKTYYYNMRESTWQEKFLKPLENNGAESIAQTFWIFDYTKGDTKMAAGKDACYTYRANLFDGSKEVKAADTVLGESLIAKCEAISTEFTEINADDNILLREWLSNTEMSERLANVMASTEMYFAQMQAVSAQAQGTVAIDTTATQPVGTIADTSGLDAVANALVSGAAPVAVEVADVEVPDLDEINI